MTPENASAEEILTRLHQGLGNNAIARALHVDKNRVARIRREHGIPVYQKAMPTLEEKWRSLTRPVAGGHLEWTGARGRSSGTPVMRYRDRRYSAAAVAFRIRYGREPVGYVIAECGVRHCVAPDHVDDQAARAATRETLRHLKGGRARKKWCVRGHEQAEHGRYLPDGTAYCAGCNAEAKAKARAAAVP
ncbi:hypothetical protein ABT160_02505 [Streptomyces sp. NPDC001941]|uniref:hypothetical protein n=1 Tax=Streptomyces sp. NPDC001941 TaxID=3154659 RepID=UPI00332B3482